MANPKEPKPTQINVELPATLEATYANMALISHTASEIIVDFASALPNKPSARINSRIVMTPMNAKLLLRALGENLSKFEEKFGEIRIPDNVILDPNRGFVK